MRYGIFSDIHGNLPAFEAVLAALKKEGIDRYICPGDVVGYGADPQPCIDRLTELNAVCVGGNHDWAVIDKIDFGYFTPAAREAVIWTKGHIAPKGVDFLNKQELIFRNQDLLMVHSRLPYPERFGYLVYTEEAARMFGSIDQQICFIGHTHLAEFFIEENGNVRRTTQPETGVASGNRYIINVGSVGQPRDGDPRAAYCVYDTVGKTISIKRVAYNIEEAQKRILAAGLPASLASRLAVGR